MQVLSHISKFDNFSGSIDRWQRVTFVEHAHKFVLSVAVTSRKGRGLIFADR
jgi:hypothetical protein